MKRIFCVLGVVLLTLVPSMYRLGQSRRDQFVWPDFRRYSVACDTFTNITEPGATHAIELQCPFDFARLGIFNLAAGCAAMVGLWFAFRAEDADIGRYYHGSHKTSADFSVVVRNPHPAQFDEREWRRFFEQERWGTVVRLTLVVSNPKYLDSLVEGKRLSERAKVAEHRHLDTLEACLLPRLRTLRRRTKHWRNGPRRALRLLAVCLGLARVRLQLLRLHWRPTLRHPFCSRRVSEQIVVLQKQQERMRRKPQSVLHEVYVTFAQESSAKACLLDLRASSTRAVLLLLLERARNMLRWWCGGGDRGGAAAAAAAAALDTTVSKENRQEEQAESAKSARKQKTGLPAAGLYFNKYFNPALFDSPFGMVLACRPPDARDIIWRARPSPLSRQTIRVAILVLTVAYTLQISLRVYTSLVSEEWMQNGRFLALAERVLVGVTNPFKAVQDVVGGAKTFSSATPAAANAGSAATAGERDLAGELAGKSEWLAGLWMTFSNHFMQVTRSAPCTPVVCCLL